MRRSYLPYRVEWGKAAIFRRSGFLTVDTRVLQCYKPKKDKLFGGESPNGLQSAVRE